VLHFKFELAFFLAARATAGIHGIIIWMFLSMGLAGQRYLKYEQDLKIHAAELTQK